MLITLFSGCKPDDPPPEPCVPPIKVINPLLFEYLPDENYSGLFYKNNQDNILNFEFNYYKYDTSFSPNICNGGGEYLAIEYEQGFEDILLKYHLTSVDTNLLTIYGGPNSCRSTFYIVIDSIGDKIDTLQLMNETFFNVYHRNAYSGSGNCCTEMYYNKQYGVVGFNWQGEWYVLETDSL